MSEGKSNLENFETGAIARYQVNPSNEKGKNKKQTTTTKKGLWGEQAN